MQIEQDIIIDKSKTQIQNYAFWSSALSPLHSKHQRSSKFQPQVSYNIASNIGT